MQYHIKWLDDEDQDTVIKLSQRVYEKNPQRYSPNLGPNSELWTRYFVHPSVKNVNTRKILGIYNENDDIVLIVGVNQLPDRPVWVLSWMLGDAHGLEFARCFKKVLVFLCDFYESQNINEFIVVHPLNKEVVYSKILKFMRDKYWTFTEIEIEKHSKPVYTEYWQLMGRTLYPYDIAIRRYIKKR